MNELEAKRIKMCKATMKESIYHCALVELKQRTRRFHLLQQARCAILFADPADIDNRVFLFGISTQGDVFGRMRKEFGMCMVPIKGELSA